MTEHSRQLPVIQPGVQSDTPPLFGKIAIVGLGLIGGSIALAARKLWPTSLVIGVDKKSVLERAMVNHAIDVAADDPVVMADADLVLLAAPVCDNVGLLADLAQHVQGTAIVTDVSSTKRDILEASRKLPARLTFIGGHPLAGAPRGGFDHARADLFRDRPWILTPTGNEVGNSLDRLQQFVEALGAVRHTMSAEEHDRVIAFLSHLPQLTASALMHVVGEGIGKEGLELSGRGLSDTTRLASSPPGIWRDIGVTNADEIGSAIDVLIEQLQELRVGLVEGLAIERVFESAATWRDALVVQRQSRQDE